MAPRFAFVPARWLAPDSGLTPADRLTLCVLCQWVNRESGECFPAIATIAAHAALSENTVRGALKRLVAVGALHIQRRKDSHGDPDTNLYTVLGYDPVKKGGGATTEVPVLQPLQGGTSTDVIEVPQPLNPNVVKENKAVDVPASAAGPDGPPSRVVTDLWHRPLPDLPPATPMTADEKAGWRRLLKGVPAPSPAPPSAP